MAAPLLSPITVYAMLQHTPRILLAAALALGGLAHAQAQVQVHDAWVRATTAQQKATGAFMQLTAAQDMRLVGVSSPAAAVAEVHTMKMEGNVMKMRPMAALDLPAGKPVQLAPGGLHIMLLDLHQQVQPGSVVPLTLELEGKDGKRQSLQVEAAARALGAAKPAGAAMH